MKLIKSYLEFSNKINESAAAELRSDLDELGYTEKGDELTSGGEITSDIAQITKVILDEFKKVAPKVKVTVTSGNDAFHHNLSYVSRHTKGQAIDITVSPDNKESRSLMIDVLNRISAGNPGFSYIDEYSKPSGSATGGHFHISYGPGQPETKATANVKHDEPIKISGLTGGAISGAQEDSVVIDSELISRLVKTLKEKGFSQDDLAKFIVKSTATVKLASAEDEDFYKAILKSIGANETPEKIKFLKAWRQGEGGKALNNPFNTTKDIPGDDDTKYNSVGVRNYPDRQTGLEATIATLKLPYYKDLIELLKRNDVTADQLANSQALTKWGTGPMVKKVLAGNTINPPAIATTA